MRIDNRTKGILAHFVLIVVSFALAVIINMLVTKHLLMRYISVIQTPSVYFTAILLQAFVVYVIVRQVIRRRWDRTSSILFWTCYFVLLFVLLFVRHSGFRGVSLNPVSFLLDVKNHQAGLMLVVGNLMLFVPFAYLFRKVQPVLCLCLFLLLNIAIEGVQYMFWLGAFDVGDITLNTLGFYLSYLFFRRTFAVRRPAVHTQ